MKFLQKHIPNWIKTNTVYTLPDAKANDAFPEDAETSREIAKEMQRANHDAINLTEGFRDNSGFVSESKVNNISVNVPVRDCNQLLPSLLFKKYAHWSSLAESSEPFEEFYRRLPSPSSIVSIAVADHTDESNSTLPYLMNERIGRPKRSRYQSIISILQRVSYFTSQYSENLENIGLPLASIRRIPEFDYKPDHIEESSCIICMTELKEKEKVRALTCFHIYHTRCIDVWLEKHRICPICKHVVIIHDNTLY